jgi:hypothetical protein
MYEYNGIPTSRGWQIIDDPKKWSSGCYHEDDGKT